MANLQDEGETDVAAALEIIHLALTDWDIRDLILDLMDLSEEKAGRILAKVNQSLLEVRIEAQG